MGFMYHSRAILTLSLHYIWDVSIELQVTLTLQSSTHLATGRAAYTATGTGFIPLCFFITNVHTKLVAMALAHLSHPVSQDRLT